MRPFRSILFLPAHKPTWAKKAVAAGADAIVLDLEDSVPHDLKEEARATARETIEALRAEGATTGILVRPNPLSTGMAGRDLEAVVGPGLDGLFVPKVTGSRDVIAWETLIDWFEERNGGANLEMIIPVEMIEAIHSAVEIATASPRVGAMIGPTAEHADIARAVGYTWTPEGLETLYLRSRVLLACRQAGIQPLTGLWERIDDLEGLRAFSEFGKQLGFRGQVIIHPSHVPVVNEVYGPSAADIEFYEGLLAAFEAGAAEGNGAVRYRGLHIDIAHADKAREWLHSVRDMGLG